MHSFNNLKRQIDAWHFAQRSILIVFTGPDQLGFGDVYFSHEEC